MNELRKRFERFFLKNRDKGIPNLMLVIAIGNLAVYVFSLIDPSNLVYSYLCFSRAAILKGQVWRLVGLITQRSVVRVYPPQPILIKAVRIF